MPKQRHLRPGDRLDDDDTIVIRGGDLDPGALRADAARYHAIYGEYGISGSRPATPPSTSWRSRRSRQTIPIVWWRDDFGQHAGRPGIRSRACSRSEELTSARNHPRGVMADSGLAVDAEEHETHRLTWADSAKRRCHLVTDEQALRASIEACARDHPGANPERVEQLVRTSYERTSGAKVHHYRVLLAERDARVQLRAEERTRGQGSADHDPPARLAPADVNPHLADLPNPAPTPRVERHGMDVVTEPEAADAARHATQTRSGRRTGSAA